MTKAVRHACLTVIVLCAATTILYPQDQLADAAFNRGRDALLQKDFNGARAAFDQSFQLRRHPLTAYGLSVAYYGMNDYFRANNWAKTALSTMPRFTLDEVYVAEARKIADWTEQQLQSRRPSKARSPDMDTAMEPLSPVVPEAMSMESRSNDNVKVAAKTTIDLTGTWRCSDGGTYFVRQVDRDLWWYGRDGDGGKSWMNVFHGQFQGNRIIGKWADLPQGSTARSSGTLLLEVQGPRHLIVRQKSGGFGGTDWTR